MNFENIFITYMKCVIVTVKSTIYCQSHLIYLTMIYQHHHKNPDDNDHHHADHCGLWFILWCYKYQNYTEWNDRITEKLDRTKKEVVMAQS
jgi:hypothetical protein